MSLGCVDLGTCARLCVHVLARGCGDTGVVPSQQRIGAVEGWRATCPQVTSCRWGAQPGERVDLDLGEKKKVQIADISITAVKGCPGAPSLLVVGLGQPFPSRQHGVGLGHRVPDVPIEGGADGVQSEAQVRCHCLWG